jgi:hypothetical protein
MLHSQYPKLNYGIGELNQSIEFKKEKHPYGVGVKPHENKQVEYCHGHKK